MRWRSHGAEEPRDGGAMRWRSLGAEEPRDGGAMRWRYSSRSGAGSAAALINAGLASNGLSDP